MQKATFAGGCFWCMEPVFINIDGVLNVVVGYTGGSIKNPTYEEVSAGTTGHVEAIQIEFDETKVSFDRLLHLFFFNIDPTDPQGQFVDKGSQYQTAVFYHHQKQKNEALDLIEELKKTRGFSKIATKILPFDHFYPAEEYHQQFFKKDPGHYESYKKGSGREGRLHHLWGPKEGCGPLGNGSCGK